MAGIDRRWLAGALCAAPAVLRAMAGGARPKIAMPVRQPETARAVGRPFVRAADTSCSKIR